MSSGHPESVEVLARDLIPPTTPFVLRLAGDTSSVPGEERADAAESLIRPGAHYVCCWGQACGRLHDRFDEAAVALARVNPPSSVHVMTTWHQGEPVEEAVWFALNSAIPTVDDEPPTRAAILVTISDRTYAARIDAYLAAGAPIRDEA